MSQLRPAILLLLLLTLVTGVVYPLLTTGLAQWLFPSQSSGSLLEEDGVARGSALIGQNFTQPNYFWGRPSASGDKPYNPLASGGSNLAASNPALDKAVADRVAALRASQRRVDPGRRRGLRLVVGLRVRCGRQRHRHHQRCSQGADHQSLPSRTAAGKFPAHALPAS